MLKLDFQVVGMNRLFSLIDTPLRDFSADWPGVFTILEDAEKEQYASLGAAGVHGEWAPHKDPAYTRRVERKYPLAQIERASGRVFYSLTGRTGDSVRRSGAMWMEFGTEARYARWQQTGTGKMVARRLMDWNEAVRTKLEKYFQRRILARYRAKGFAVSRGFLSPGETIGAGEARRIGLAAYEREAMTPLSAAM